MRVIGGSLKGYRLKSLRGLGIRPTSDLVREAIFSMLESMDVDWSRVLDLYAGSGALGIEALSRGAEWTDFVERDPKCCSLIKRNLEHTKLTTQGNVYCMNIAKSLSRLDKQYSIVFLDPPYSDPATTTVLEELASSRLMRDNSTIVLEHSRRLSPESSYGSFSQTKNLSHGDTRVSVYQCIGGTS
ncbi:16S rRNA (guanine(966)-N(2))-methyltransferase RsmD [Chloroflexota bacterium]